MSNDKYSNYFTFQAISRFSFELVPNPVETWANEEIKQKNFLSLQKNHSPCIWLKFFDCVFRIDIDIPRVETAWLFFNVIFIDNFSSLWGNEGNFLFEISLLFGHGNLLLNYSFLDIYNHLTYLKISAILHSPRMYSISKSTSTPKHIVIHLLVGFQLIMAYVWGKMSLTF